MIKTYAAGIAWLTLLAGPVMAQTTCEPAKLAAAIDRYAAAPFSAVSWRVLHGLGDPMIEPAAVGGDTWELQQRWKALASEILPDSETLQDVSWNCRIGYPLSVLEKRVNSFGKQHPYVKQWLTAQEQVMRACGSDTDAVAMPAPIEVEPAYVNLQNYDRTYQEASVAFYRDKEKAIPMFRAIGETKSPHRAAARYNVANLLANAKQPEAARKEAEAILADPSLNSVHVITRELLGYIANQEDTAQGWTGLIDGDIAILEMPAARVTFNDDNKRAFASALYDIDLVGVRGKEGDWWLDGTLPQDATISKALVDASRKYPMALWMMAGQSANEKYQIAPWSLIGDMWQTHMSDYIGKALAVQPTGGELKGPALDMLMALAAKPDDATRAELWAKAKLAMDAAEKSCGTAPETAAAGFLLQQATRLSALAGQYDEAAANLNSVPIKGARAYSGVALYNLAQYIAGQGNAEEARRLRDALITPEFLAGLEGDTQTFDRSRYSALLALIAEDEARWKQAIVLNSDPASDILFNLLPTKTLWAFSADPAFTLNERALFARAAWTRDYGLVRKVDGESLERLYALNPELRAISEKVKADYPEISPRNQRLLTILRSPAHNVLVSMPGGWQAESIKPDSFTEIDVWNPNDKNWWCPFEPNRQLGALRKQADYVVGIPDANSYLMRKLADVYDPAMSQAMQKNRETLLKAHPMVKAVNWKEIRALTRMDQAPERLSNAAIRWGKASKGEDGAAEALALAVKTTRYGCSWHGSHARYSKAAQELLTAKFNGTPWQERTPYWFSCQRMEWNKDFTEKVASCEPKTWPKQAPLR